MLPVSSPIGNFVMQLLQVFEKLDIGCLCDTKELTNFFEVTQAFDASAFVNLASECLLEPRLAADGASGMAVYKIPLLLGLCHEAFGQLCCKPFDSSYTSSSVCACELPGGGRCPECMGPINDQANVFPEPHIGDDYSVSKAEPGV